MDRPDELSPEWSDYVLSLFSDEEKVGDHPNIHGLRRVAELLIGQIIESGPTVIIPKDGNIESTTVVYKVKFLKDGKVIEYGDVADVNFENTGAFFSSFASAVACTRAEGRTLRKALRIRSVAAEELGPDREKVEKQVSSNNDGIKPEQIVLIKKKCEELDINVEKFINSGKRKYDSLHDINRDTAIKMIKQLNEYSNNDVPNNLKGFTHES